MKNPGLAAVLSFFITGLGQIYNGQIAKGLLLMVAQTINVFVLNWVLGLGYVLAFIVWLWAIIDAYKYAEKSNQKSQQPL